MSAVANSAPAADREITGNDLLDPIEQKQDQDQQAPAMPNQGANQPNFVAAPGEDAVDRRANVDIAHQESMRDFSKKTEVEQFEFLDRHFKGTIEGVQELWGRNRQDVIADRLNAGIRPSPDNG